ncbi:MAG: Xaa-Pro peptidase family protein [Candidatus Abyssubacteria bacterium]
MKERVEAIQQNLREAGADAFICYSYPNYRYLSGFSGSLAILLISRTSAILMSDFRYRTQVHEEVSGFEFVEIKGPIEDATVALIKEQGVAKLAFESAHLTYRNYAHLKSIDSVELMPTENWVEDLRVVKDAGEIGLIEEAASIADAAMEAIFQELKPGMTEKQVADRLNTLLRSRGGKKEAFDLIVASGPRSAMPHGAASDRVICAGEPIVIDIGAQFQGYHSDLTRTVWIDKIETRQMREVYEIVANAQASAIDAIRPDMPCADIDAVARTFIADRGYGESFGHGLGHGVGLDVHELPVISRLGKGSVRPGMVFTVEPGIYIPEVGGVRIEDMVVVTDNGCRKLTGSAKPAELKS